LPVPAVVAEARNTWNTEQAIFHRRGPHNMKSKTAIAALAASLAMYLPANAIMMSTMRRARCR